MPGLVPPCFDVLSARVSLAGLILSLSKDEAGILRGSTMSGHGRRANAWRWAGAGALVGFAILLVRMASQPVALSDPDPAVRWGAVAGFLLGSVLLGAGVGVAAAALRNMLWRRR